MVESHSSGILFYKKLKKLERYDVNTLYSAPLRFIRQECVHSSFNIQYQSTWVDPLPSLSEIELRRSVRGLFPSSYGTFRWPGTYKIFFLEISIKVCGAATSKINQTKQY